MSRSPVAALSALVLAGSSLAGTVGFNRDIRPIFSETCYLCHGPDKGTRKAGLRLDQREAALAGVDGRPSIVPGNSAASEVYRRLVTSDEELRMPHRDSRKTLTAPQIALIRKWIDEGAEYEPHWSCIPPRKKAPPGPGHPVDAFIRASLETAGLKASAEADRRTLIRRLSLDLTGLPPTPAEVEAFLADQAADAYDRLVDRLLASPHYGERMAVPWLDAVRFADTVGYHGDQHQNIFPYRDYVIDAFNSNKPFDRFTLEQLAGDLLPNPTVEQRVATGFNRLNMMTREGGAQAKEYIAKYQADRVRTVAGAWMGATMGCAECHDHKFDPFTQKDFYSMEAFFADLKQWGVYADYGYTPNTELKGYNNDSPFPPQIAVESRALQARRDRFRQKMTALAVAASTNADAAAFAQWREETRGFVQRAQGRWLTPAPAGTNLTVEADGRLVLASAAATDETVRLQIPAGWLAAIRVELLPHAQHGNSILRTAAKSGATIKLAATLQYGTGTVSKLSFQHADANLEEPRHVGGAALYGMLDGWRTSPADWDKPHIGTWWLDQPVSAAEAGVLAVTLPQCLAGCLRISVTPFAWDMAGDLDQLLRDPAPSPAVCDAYLAGTAWEAGAYVRYKALAAQAFACHDGHAMTMVSEAAAAPLPTRVLPRGNWQDESGPLVEPAVPHFLAQPANPANRRLTRLDLAQWLVAADNPLTGRAVMNRMWKQFFGAGLSAVVDDLGAQGEWPVHPELLDWLAVEFRERGWDVKHMVKLLVTSATYRQDARLRPGQLERDPNNRLLASQSPRRLEAEFVRDNALFIAGLLNPDVGGPSAHPYQPAGYYANLQFPDRDYHADKDDRQYRRGVYMHWQRTFLHPMLANFDAPSRDEGVCARTVANTPQQALTLLNDPTFVEATRVFAEDLLLSAARTDDERLALAFQKALARPPKTNEQQSLAAFLGVQREYYKSNAEDAQKLTKAGLAAGTVPGREPAPGAAALAPAELAAWTQVCRVVLNLHETLTRY